MKLRSRVPAPAGVSGTARSDRRTTALLARLREGDVAVLDQVDLDGHTAEALVDARVAVVLNRSAMISGRLPSRGAEVLAEAGIPMVDNLQATGGRELASVVPDGRRIRVLGGSVLIGDEVVAEGRELGGDEVASQLDSARLGLAAQLQTLTHDSGEFIRREQGLLLHGDGVPRLRTRLQGTPRRRGRARSRRRGRAARDAPLPARDEAGGGHHRRGARGGPRRRAASRCRRARRTRGRACRRPRSCARSATSSSPSRRGSAGRRAPSGSTGSACVALTLRTGAAPGDAALLLADAAGGSPDRRGRAPGEHRGAARRQP